MLLLLPTNLHYPITIIKVEVRAGQSIGLNENLFMYSYTTTVKVGQRNSDEEEEVEKKFIAHFPSTLEGIIQTWRVWEGDVLTQPIEICDIEEECSHAVQYLGMCTNCGKDMTLLQPGGAQDTGRATIQPLHDTQHLTISQDEANEIDKEAKRRLLASRKLSLVVDLDQTIIHAAVDPTIAEWQNDKDNPNYEAVKDVRKFQLIDEGPSMRGCWYYIKLRPGLQEFLEHISQLYELHIYTMGTRQYAQQIANIVDPDRIYFGDRILSRDESGSMVAKNLERLFPVDTKMVVIIDDRGDVWKWSANLIRVTPFDFFVGIGDINSSFLPKKQEIQSTPKSEDKKDDEEEKEKNGDPPKNGVAEDGTSTIQNGTSALEQLVAMSGSDDPKIREMQSQGQQEVISSQLEEKPLLKMQQKLDELSEAETPTNSDITLSPITSNGDSVSPSTSPEVDLDSNSSSSSSSTTTPTSTPSKARHSILKDDDEELIHLENRLTAVHTAFYNEYDRRRLNTKGGRVGALVGKRKQPLPDHDDQDSLTDTPNIPDVKKVMPSMKMRVLPGVVIVFSGVLPLGTNIQTADISTWAKTFGARIADRVSREVTHVIAARAGTAKVKQAVKRGIKVVSTGWLISSIQQWRKLDERPFLLEGAGQRKMDPTSSDIEKDVGQEHLTTHDFMLSSSEGEGSDTGFGDTDADVDEQDFEGDLSIKQNGSVGHNDSHVTETENDLNSTSTEDGPPKKRLKLNTNTNGEMTPRITVTGSTTDSEPEVEDGSPITIDQDEWDDMDAELKEFMGSEVDSESDNDSVSSKLSMRDKRASIKRKRQDDEDTNSGTDGEGGTSKTLKTGPTSAGGGSALRKVRNVESPGDTPPRTTPTSASTSIPASNDGTLTNTQQEQEEETTDSISNSSLAAPAVPTDAQIRHEQNISESNQRDEEAEEEDSDDELARELERELEEGD